MKGALQRTIEAYNLNCLHYAAKFADYAPYVEQVQKFSTYLQSGDRVLDLGCGPGNVAKQLSMAKPLGIEGVDLSEKMVHLAQQNVPQGKFQVQDLRKAEFDAASFDAIVLSFSIVHLREAEALAVLKKAATWLKRDGYIYVSFMEGKQPGFEKTSFSEQELYFNYFREEQIKKTLEESNISCVRIEKKDYLEEDGSATTDVFVFGRKTR